jgi:hypothetical protein
MPASRTEALQQTPIRVSSKTQSTCMEKSPSDPFALRKMLIDSLFLRHLQHVNQHASNPVINNTPIVERYQNSSAAS